MSKKKVEEVDGFGKPLALSLALASMIGHGGESVEQESGTLTESKVQRSIYFVAYLPHGAESWTGYTHTIDGIVRMAATSS